MMKQIHCEKMRAPHYCLRTAEMMMPECDKPDCPGRQQKEKAQALLREVFPAIPPQETPHE